MGLSIGRVQVPLIALQVSFLSNFLNPVLINIIVSIHLCIILIVFVRTGRLVYDCLGYRNFNALVLFPKYSVPSVGL